MPSKLCVSAWGWGGKFGEEFYSKGSRVALLIRIRGCANLASVGLLTRFCGYQPMTFSLEWRMLYQVGNNFHFWGFQFFRRAHKYCYVNPLRQNQDPFPRLCTVYYFLWFFLLYLCIPSLLWLATVWTCCLKFREGRGGTERLPCPGAPQGPAWFQISFYCLGKFNSGPK